MTANLGLMAAIETETKPAPKQIDALIASFAAAQSNAAEWAACAKVRADKAGEIKVHLTAMVETWGGRHTEKSKRLVGLHNTATTTTATRVSIVDEAVEKLRNYLGTTETPDLAEEFFVEHISYSLVSGPDEKLKTLTMGARLRTKIAGMLKSCFEIKTSAPSLKVDVPELKSAA